MWVAVDGIYPVEDRISIRYRTLIISELSGFGGGAELPHQPELIPNFATRNPTY